MSYSCLRLLPLLAMSGISSWASASSDDWSLRAVNVYEAWDMLRTRDSDADDRVVVAHIDTGLSEHPELAGGNILWDKAYNFIDGNRIVFHRFSKGQFPGHGHGSETLSVMASPAGCPAENGRGPCVTGVAPGAFYLPLLVTDSSIIGSGANVAKAVDYAVEVGAHVINISLGNVVPMPEVERAIIRAVKAGVIVVAAAGNSTGGVKVFPGAYPAAIAVGGTTESGDAWSGSTRGSYVAWSAPASGVFAALVKKTKGDSFEYSVFQAEGTSDAAAITSGVAALWLAYHGRENLLARFGGEGLVRSFRRIVTEYGVSAPDGWPTQTYGAGIINAQKTLAAPLSALSDGVGKQKWDAQNPE
jgi:serine protease